MIRFLLLIQSQQVVDAFPCPMMVMQSCDIVVSYRLRSFRGLVSDLVSLGGHVRREEILMEIYCTD